MIELTKEDFEKKVVSMKDYVYNLALAWTNNPEKAKDIRQETLLRALESWGDYFDKNLKGWMSTIARNIFLSDIEEQKRRQTVSYDQDEDMGDYGEDRGISYIGNPQADLEEKETHNIISGLPKTNRIPIQMRGKGFTHEEIGEKMALNTNAVKARVHKGKIMLKNRLEDKPVYSGFISLLACIIDSLLFICLFLIDCLFWDL